MIEQLTDQAQELTDSLLMFAREKSTKKSPIELGNLVVDSMRLIRGLFPASIEIELGAITKNNVWVTGNKAGLQQVMINLALNARDAMSQGGRLSLSLQIERPDNGSSRKQAVLTIADTGQGISQDLMPRIFEPFFTSKERDKGSGLGLAVVHGIVTDHQGRIEVDSHPNRGTRFIVGLPVCPPPRIRRTTDQTKPPSYPDKRLILVGQANEYIREIMISTLESAGYQTIHAADRPTVIEQTELHRAKLSLVILDIDSLKDTDQAWLRQWRAHDSTLPTIVITQDGNGRQATDPQDGVVQVLTKPFEMAQLLAAVKYQLRRT